MNCPKCNAQIEKHEKKCKNCGMKVRTVCKNCGTLNPISAINCSNCKKPILKICENCGAINTLEAKNCRKCKTNFIESQILFNNLNSVQKMSQQKIKTNLNEAIKDFDKKIITLNGESGSGKTLIIKNVINELSNVKLLWLNGSCNQTSQMTTFGYFQDLLLNFFNINNFCIDTLQLKKSSIKFFKQDFPSLTNSEIYDLLNFLYPENTDNYENIYKNKCKYFEILKKIFYTIIDKIKVIFIIDNFEYIDGMSYDFFKELMKNNIFFERCKIIILTTLQKPGMGLISTPELSANNYENFYISPFTELQTNFLYSQSEIQPSQDYISITNSISQGVPAYIEQMVTLYKTSENLAKKITKFDNINKIIDLRLNLLKQENLLEYKILIALSILGTKFYPAILEGFENLSLLSIEQHIESLVKKNFISKLNNLSYEFKSNNIWEIIINIVKQEECFNEVIQNLLNIITKYKHSSIALLAFMYKKIENDDKAFQIWTQIMKQTNYIGDIGLYIIVQQQALNLIENKQDNLSLKIKQNINKRLGKILEPIKPQLAFSYLQTAIMMLNDNDENEHIELLGYLASASMKIGNFWGVIECINKVDSILTDEQKLEKSLLKTKLVKPLLKLGNYGQLINIIETEILSNIEKLLVTGKNTQYISNIEIFNLWIELYIDYAEALIFQGQNKCFTIINLIYDIIEKNKISNQQILCKVHLLLALANTIKGDINTSEKILENIIKDFELEIMNKQIISRWNFIDILNKFFLQKYDNISSELFNVVSYANNVNDSFTKNILKTIFTKILFDKNEAQKSLTILDEQVSYFATEKIATGVLLSWYLIALIKLNTKGTQVALDIVTRALDIAQSPNINNYYFIALFNKLIGEIYLAKQDFESSKIYIEKSIMIAKKFELERILLENFILEAKLYQELAMPKTQKRLEYIKKAIELFQQAKKISIVENHYFYKKKIKDEISILTSFCKLNKIILKKNI